MAGRGRASTTTPVPATSAHARSARRQYPRPGVVYRPLRDAPPVAVRLVWWRDDAHPATAAAVGLLTGLFRRP